MERGFRNKLRGSLKELKKLKQRISTNVEKVIEECKLKIEIDN